MTAILHRLQASGFIIPRSQPPGVKAWPITAKFVESHHVLSVEYRVHCAQLAHDLLRKPAAELTAQLQAALEVAELLEQLYGQYLYEPREVWQLHADQAVYRRLLAIPVDPLFEANHYTGWSVSHTIREFTASTNWLRQVTVRCRRLLLTLSPLLQDYQGCRHGILMMDKLAGPVLIYIAWIVFLPRLLTNLMLTAKHVIPGSWMSKEEGELGWKTRLRIQLASRWFELGNDAVWCVAGLLNCFVLLGALAPMSIYLTFALQTFDVLFAGLRAYVELNRLEKLQAAYQTLPESADYLKHLQTCIAYQTKRLYLGVINTSLMLCSVSLALPMLAFSPIIPFIGAALAVLATIIIYNATQWVELQKPQDKIIATPPASPQALTKFGLFGFGRSSSPPAMQYTPDETLMKR